MLNFYLSYIPFFNFSVTAIHHHTTFKTSYKRQNLHIILSFKTPSPLHIIR